MILKNNPHKFISHLFSMRYLGVLFLLFAMVCGIATFVENTYGTEVARVAVYNSKWFEALLLMAVFALGYNIFVFRLFFLPKLPVGLFHLAFIIIILGAGITRYTGKEGKMHIRQGEKVSFYIEKSPNGWLKTPLPFTLELNKFEIEYYSGSKTPSEYRSKMTVWKHQEKIQDYEIYMNHILKYKGYRFYQSSYDDDYAGTILMVSRDPWGMGITYAGYFFLVLGMLTSLFAKGGRFQLLFKQLQQHQIIVCLFVLLTFPLLSNAATTVDQSTAKAFGKLWVSNGKGRILPMNTFDINLLKKISKESSYQHHSADEVILSIFLYPEEWKNEPLIPVPKTIKELLNLPSDYAAYRDFFNKNGEYRLMETLQSTLVKPAGERNKTDKALIKVTEQVSVFNLITEGTFLDIYYFNNQWFSPYALSQNTDKSILNTNINLIAAIKSKDCRQLESAFVTIETLQSGFGNEIVPTKWHKKTELIYNRINLFTRLAPFYATIAVLLLMFSIISIINKRKIKVLTHLKKLIYLGFILQTVGLIMRWYISGRPPMGNGYESMIMVAWVSILGGLLLSKKSTITLAISTILAAATLLVAHINSMNPEITVLVPVLDSYWLSFHVATITAGYALLGSCALLGFFNSVILAFGVRKKTQFIVKELTITGKILMIIGTYLLTIGCFIGAIWANESWGRYWSWDPKETWCLISIVVYAFILHMHHIPRLSGDVAYNIAAIWGISTIIMTYFGVNYFLGGMHSYAGGEAPNFPFWGYCSIIVLLAISVKAVLNKCLDTDNAKV